MMFFSFDELIRRLIREDDRELRADQERHEKLRLEIMSQARRLRQEQQQNMQLQPKVKERRRFLPHYVYNLRNIWPKHTFDSTMELALGSILLLMGLWVGQHLIPQQGTALAQNVQEQKISVMAMASPWEGWIEGGE